MLPLHAGLRAGEQARPVATGGQAGNGSRSPNGGPILQEAPGKVKLEGSVTFVSDGCIIHGGWAGMMLQPGLPCNAEMELPMTDSPYSSKTPCVGLCSTVYGDLVCRGCKRFSHEIIDWNRYGLEAKTAVWNRLAQLLTQIVMARVEVVSALQLRETMAARQIAFIDDQPLAFQIWRLLSRADAPALEECGMRARAEYADLTLKQLREGIDRDYFSLSEAYYQRHQR